MEPEPADMLVFAAVVREGGLTAAARALGTTKQRVSQRLASLETALGVRLLERTTRAVRPTEAGAAYFQHCEAIAARIREANEGVRAAQEQATGRLRVSAPTLLGRRLLAPVVTAYLQAHPRVTLELSLADRRVDLLQEGFDLAIRVGDLDDSSLRSRALGVAEAVFVASPGLLAGKAPPTAADVHEWPWLGMHDGERWQLRDRRVQGRQVLVVNDLELLCAAAISGLGLARLPRMVCDDALADGRLVRVLADDAPPRTPIHAVFPSRAYLPARVRLFLDLLAAHLQRASLDDA
jgi:DNA-binding transcriptional LysR family regulator